MVPQAGQNLLFESLGLPQLGQASPAETEVTRVPHLPQKGRSVWIGAAQVGHLRGIGVPIGDCARVPGTPGGVAAGREPRGGGSGVLGFKGVPDSS